MLDRDSILEEAFLRCMEEMYERSQPKGSFKKYCEMLKNGEIPKDTRVYERHYLPQKEFEYILNKYIKAYDLENQWHSDCDLIMRDLEEGGYRDIYVKDEDGHGHREAEHTKPLKDLIGEEHAKVVLDLIKDFKDFYRFDRDGEKFNFSVCLGASPTSNPNIVKEYWKSQGVDIEIDTKDNLTEDDYWEIDYYGHILEEDDDDLETEENEQD